MIDRGTWRRKAVFCGGHPAGRFARRSSSVRLPENNLFARQRTNSRRKIEKILLIYRLKMMNLLIVVFAMDRRVAVRELRKEIRRLRGRISELESGE
jgi:hypothetical protein